MEFVNIVTGKPFKGKLPDAVDVLGSDKEFIRTTVHRVEPGDTEWNDAIVWWMYVHGYMPESELELGEKGGTGSGNWGHRGRPGLVGGSGGRGGVGDVVSAVTGAGKQVTGEIIQIKTGPDQRTWVQLRREDTDETHWVRRGKIASEVGDVLEEKKPAVNLVYHGTSGDVARGIMSQGLRAFSDEELGRTPSVYYTESKDMALRYGRGSLLGPSSMYAIIEFEVPKGLKPIPDEVGSPGDYRIEGSVPPGAIASIQVFDVNNDVVETLKSVKMTTGYAVILIDGEKGGDMDVA